MGKVSEEKQSVGGLIDAHSSRPAPGPDITWFLQRSLIHFLFITVVGLFCYSNTFHGPFQWDEKREILENPVIKDLDNFVSSTKGYDYNPRRFIGYLSFALNYHFGRLNVVGYHMVNLLIHISNATLVYFLIVLIFRTPYFRTEKSEVASRQAQAPSGRPAPSDNTACTLPDYFRHSRLIALFVALLFVSHPLQTQAVTYVVQRLTSLATSFYLLSLVLYLAGRLSSSHIGKPASYLLALFSAVCAMKTKEIAFTLPVVIVLVEFIFFGSGLKKKLILLLPIVLTLIVIPLSMMGSDRPLGEVLSDLSEKTRVQTDISRGEYLMTEMRVIVTYIRLLLFPVNQNLDYDYPVYHSFFTPPVFLSFLFLASIFGLGVYLLCKSRLNVHTCKSPTFPFTKGEHGGITSKGMTELEAQRREQGMEIDPSGPCPPYLAYYRLIAFGILWFFITLSVESSIIPIADVIFEHRVYLPSVGFFIAITAGAFLLTHKLRREKAVALAFVLITLVLSGVTYARNKVWTNEMGLWEDIVKKSPIKARPHGNLGTLFHARNRLDEAITEYRTALRLNPGYVEAHNYLAEAYLDTGRPDEAIRELETAVKLNPDYPTPHANLAVAYSVEGRTDEAIREFQTALRLNPDYADAYNLLGTFYSDRGLLDEALRAYQTAIRLNPDHAEAHDNLAVVYSRLGNTDEALREVQNALTLKPDYAEAHNNLGNIYYAQGHPHQAIREYEAALRLKPDYAAARNNLTILYKKTGSQQ